MDLSYLHCLQYFTAPQGFTIFPGFLCLFPVFFPSFSPCQLSVGYLISAIRQRAISFRAPPLVGQSRDPMITSCCPPPTCSLADFSTCPLAPFATHRTCHVMFACSFARLISSALLAVPLSLSMFFFFILRYIIISKKLKTHDKASCWKKQDSGCRIFRIL